MLRREWWDSRPDSIRTPTWEKMRFSLRSPPCSTRLPVFAIFWREWWDYLKREGWSLGIFCRSSPSRSQWGNKVLTSLHVSGTSLIERWDFQSNVSTWRDDILQRSLSCCSRWASSPQMMAIGHCAWIEVPKRNWCQFSTFSIVRKVRIVFSDSGIHWTKAVASRTNAGRTTKSGICRSSVATG
jgi:hypothetical protein